MLTPRDLQQAKEGGYVYAQKARESVP
jgi:hypothetical protein